MATSKEIKHVYKEKVNRTETYSWMIYQLYEMWMQNLYKSFYLSTDLAKLAPVWDEKLSYEESVKRLNAHIKNVAPLRDKLIGDYIEAENILQNLLKYGVLPRADRPSEIPIDEGFNPETGEPELRTISRKEMIAEIDRIMRIPSEDMTARDVALMNGYKGYLGSFRENDVKTMCYILRQITESACASLDVMRNIMASIPEQISDFNDEMRAKNGGIEDERFRDKTREEIFDITTKEFGGLIKPAISTAMHIEYTKRANEANLKGVGFSAKKGGSLETPDFEFLTPLLFSSPGAGKNSILELMAQKAMGLTWTLNLPQTTESDFAMPAYNASSNTVDTSLVSNMYEIGTNIGVLILDECLRANREGVTGMDRLQDFLHHRRLNPQNHRNKANPGVFMALATNTDKDAKVGETKRIGQANKDRIVPFHISDDMFATGRSVYLHKKFGKIIAMDTPEYEFLSFLADPTSGASQHLNVIEMFKSNYEDLTNPMPSGRPITIMLEEMAAKGADNYTFSDIKNKLRPIVSETFLAEFDKYYRISTALPSINDMLKAKLNGKPLSEAFNSLIALGFEAEMSIEEGKIKVKSIDDKSYYMLNGGIGWSQKEMDTIKKDMLSRRNPDEPEQQIFMEKIKVFYDSIKTKNPEKAKSLEIGIKYLEGLTEDKAKQEIEGWANAIFKMKTIDSSNMSEEHAKEIAKIKTRGLSDPMVQKILCDRVINSLEQHIHHQFANRMPLDSDVLKGIFSIVALTAFPNFKENMISRINNLFMKMPDKSPLLIKGLREYGIKFPERKEVLKGSPEETDRVMLVNMFKQMPIIQQALGVSESFRQTLMGRSATNISFDTNM